MAIIFIGGSQRTGTSAVQQLLCQLPEANPYIYEASYLRMLVACYADARNSFSANHASYFADVGQLRQFQGGVVHAFLDHTSRVLGGCHHLVLKEPHLTILWPFLHELVPEAWMIMMMRDPRDVIASMIDVGERQKSAGQNYLFTERNIRKLCEHFISFYKPSFEVEDEGFRNQLAVVHYENVMTDPQTALEQIAGFTGVPFHRIDPNKPLADGHVDQAAISSSRHYAPWATDVSGQTMSPGRIGRYRDVLSPQEIADVEGYLADFFEWFGYSHQAA